MFATCLKSRISGIRIDRFANLCNVTKRYFLRKTILIYDLAFLPGAPPFIDTLGNDFDDDDLNITGFGGNLGGEVNIGNVSGASGSGRPTLKDYLDMTKANKMPMPGKSSEGSFC